MTCACLPTIRSFMPATTPSMSIVMSRTMTCWSIFTMLLRYMFRLNCNSGLSSGKVAVNCYETYRTQLLMCLCMCVYLHVYKYMHVRMHEWTHVHACMYIFKHKHKHACITLYMSILSMCEYTFSLQEWSFSYLSRRELLEDVYLLHVSLSSGILYWLCNHQYVCTNHHDTG